MNEDAIPEALSKIDDCRRINVLLFLQVKEILCTEPDLGRLFNPASI